jgi:hypothetical protein
VISIPVCFKSSAWERVCWKSKFKFSLLRLTRVPSFSQRSFCNWTCARRCSLVLDSLVLTACRGCSHAALP